MRTIAHLSDLHFGRIDPLVVAGLESDLRRHPPDLVVVSGDLVQDARTSNFEAAAAFLRALPFAKLVVPGNHDIPRYDLLGRFVGDPFRRYRRHIGDDLSPVHIDDEIAVLGLNTARSVILDFSQGRVNTRQLARVRDVFAPLPPHLLRVLVTHHPFLPPPGMPRARLVGRVRMALPILEEAGVDLLLAGHTHRAYTGDMAAFHRGMGRSILVAQAATSTSTRLRDEANAYNRISVDADALACEVRAWDGEAFRPARSGRHPRQPRPHHGTSDAPA